MISRIALAGNEETNICATVSCDGHGACVVKNGMAACACYSGHMNTDVSPLSCVPQTMYYPTEHMWPQSVRAQLNPDYADHLRKRDGIKGSRLYPQPSSAKEENSCAAVSCNGVGTCMIRTGGQPECICEYGYAPEPRFRLNCVSDVIAPNYRKIYDNLQIYEREQELKSVDMAPFERWKPVLGNAIDARFYQQYVLSHPNGDYLRYLDGVYAAKYWKGVGAIILGTGVAVVAVVYQVWLFDAVPPGSAYWTNKNCEGECGGGLLYALVWGLYAVAIIGDSAAVAFIVTGTRLVRRNRDLRSKIRRLQSANADRWQYRGISSFRPGERSAGVGLSWSF